MTIHPGFSRSPLIEGPVVDRTLSWIWHFVHTFTENCRWFIGSRKLDHYRLAFYPKSNKQEIMPNYFGKMRISCMVLVVFAQNDNQEPSTRAIAQILRTFIFGLMCTMHDSRFLTMAIILIIMQDQDASLPCERHFSGNKAIRGDGSRPHRRSIDCTKLISDLYGLVARDCTVCCC